MYLSAEDLQNMDIGQPMGLPVSQKSKNRLYLSWMNAKGQQCKMIGPETKCFCNHKLKDHEYLNPQGKKVPCKSPKCKCRCFDYIPSHGAYDFKCLCKHSFKEHDCISKVCARDKCNQCKGFASAWTCSCGSKFSQHSNLIQNYEERKQRGKVMNDMGRLNQELNHLSEEGSLLKPVKEDRQERAKKRWSASGATALNNPFIGLPKQQQCEDESLEQYSIAMKNKKTD